MAPKPRIKGTVTKKLSRSKPTRFRFASGTSVRDGRRVRKRFGFRNGKVVEVSFVPVKRR